MQFSIAFWNKYFGKGCFATAPSSDIKPIDVIVGVVLSDKYVERIKVRAHASAGFDAKRKWRDNMEAYSPDMELNILLGGSLIRKKLRERTGVLSQKYNLRSMDRNQYSRLLAELRDVGIITNKEYSAAYGGTLPHSPGTMPRYPYGRESIDFVRFLGDCAAYCEAVASDPDLIAIYTKLGAIFSQIDQARQPVPE